MNTRLKLSNSLIILLKHNHLRFPKTYWYIHNNRMHFNAPMLSIQRTKYGSSGIWSDAMMFLMPLVSIENL